jgi:hypothetical protein
MQLLRATVATLTEERGADENIWASMVKQAIKRRHPGFNERAYGFDSFTEFLREAQTRGLVELEEKSGNCLVRPAPRDRPKARATPARSGRASGAAQAAKPRPGG